MIPGFGVGERVRWGARLARGSPAPLLQASAKVARCAAPRSSSRSPPCWREHPSPPPAPTFKLAVAKHDLEAGATIDDPEKYFEVKSFATVPEKAIPGEEVLRSPRENKE